MSLQVLTAATSTNSPPSGAGAGFALTPTLKGQDSLALFVKSTAGSDVMTVTLKLWYWSDVSSSWMPAGTNATAANKGLLNGGNAIAETGTDTIAHTEILPNHYHYDRIYIEVTAIGGTATAISAWVNGSPYGRTR